MRFKNKFKLTNVICLLFIFILITFEITTINVKAASYQDPVVFVGDITRIKGIRDNQLFGFGLVIGLAGTGDSNRYQPTIQSHANMLKRMGLEVTPDQVNSRNVAAVMVTAKLPAFAHIGDTIDVTISSMGDASSLQGGTLFMTPLKAANGEIFAVAQGPTLLGGFSSGQGGSSVSKGHSTVSRIPNGAMVERELEFKLDNKEIIFYLNQPNPETARNIALGINRYFDVIYTEEKLAKAVDPGQVKVKVPLRYQENVLDYITKINNLEIRPGFKAKVVINEKTGTIVMGHNVRISTTSVTTGSLTVTVTSSSEVSQPPSFSDGQTVMTEETDIKVEEKEGHLMVMPTGGTIDDLVTALNAVGATPGDIINIIQALKKAGALYAELEII